jgi:hypothetical protein
MFARLLAAFCLFNLVVVSAWGSPSEPSPSEIVVYLSASAAQPQRPLDFMKLELGRLMRTAGYRMEWSDARTPERSTTDSVLAVVDLRGTCEAGVPSTGKTTALASTAVSEGRVLPFSSVDCASLTRVLATALAAEAPARRDYLYGRAMARLLAHELYHILLQTQDHSREGIARPAFTAVDLLTEHFEFEVSTLAKLRPAVPARGTDSGDSVAR